MLLHPLNPPPVHTTYVRQDDMGKNAEHSIQGGMVEDNKEQLSMLPVVAIIYLILPMIGCSNTVHVSHHRFSHHLIAQS